VSNPDVTVIVRHSPRKVRSPALIRLILTGRCAPVQQTIAGPFWTVIGTAMRTRSHMCVRCAKEVAAMTLTDLLAEYHVTADDLSASLESRLLGRVQPGAADLTLGEEAFWAQHAGLPLDREVQPALERTSEEAAALLSAASRSLTIEQAADRLDLHRSRISHRLREGRLYAFSLGAQRRLPTWQFTAEGAVVTGLDRVLAALPSDLHPAEVEGFFTTPNPDLNGRPPVEWLTGGGDPQRVVDEAAGLDRW